MELKKADIHKIQGDYAFLNISTDINEKASGFYQKFRLDKIKYNNEIASRALLKVNPHLNVKIDGNIISEAYVNLVVEIIVIYGKICSVNTENKSLKIDEYCCTNEISWNELVSSSGQKLPNNIIPTLVGSPILISYHKNLIFECKIADESKVISLTLSSFERSQNRWEEEPEYFYFKDSYSNLHKIANHLVFYRNSTSQFSKNSVGKNQGVEVKVFIKNKEFRAEVSVDMLYSIVQPRKYSKDDIPLSKISDPKPNIRLTKKTENETNQNILNKTFNSFSDTKLKILPSQLSKMYGKRILDKSSGLYYKPNENNKNTFIILLGLFETVYRFPDHKIKKILYEQLIQESQKLGNFGVKSVIDKVFNIIRDPRRMSRIEEVYRKLIVYKNIFEALIKNLIKDPLNYDELAELYEISFCVATRGKEWKAYHPFAFAGNSFQSLLIQETPEFCILYTQDMMLFDGYDLKSLEYTHPKNIDPEKLKFPYQPQSPNTLEHFQNILDLVSFSSEHVKGSEEIFYELMKKLNGSLKTLSDSVKPEKFSALSEIYKKITQVKVKDLSCQCGNEENSKYFCSNNHSLCKKCALVSTRIEKCLYCEAYVSLDVSGELYECTICKGSYEAIYYVGFPCNCIYCTCCANEVIIKKYCIIHSIPISDNICIPIYQYLQNIWNK